MTSFICRYSQKAVPENLFLNGEKGLPLPYGLPGVALWDCDLISAMAKKKIYDLSRYSGKSLELMVEHEWLYQTFIQPYEEKKVDREKSLKYRLDHTGVLHAIVL